jgi:hypothetical protein
MYMRRIKAKRVAGGAVLTASDTIGSDSEDDAAFGGITTIDASSNDVRVRITGAANMNISWRAHAEIVGMTP